MTFAKILSHFPHTLNNRFIFSTPQTPWSSVSRCCFRTNTEWGWPLRGDWDTAGTNQNPAWTQKQWGHSYMTHRGPGLNVLLLLKRAFTMNPCECAFIPLKQKGFKILHLKGIIKYTPVGTKEQEKCFFFTLPQWAEPKLFQLYEFKSHLSPTCISKTSRKKQILNSFQFKWLRKSKNWCTLKLHIKMQLLHQLWVKALLLIPNLACVWKRKDKRMWKALESWSNSGFHSYCCCLHNTC